ncbi:hypothetical protein SUDANB120_02716 [Streptomyces sp. enrichment culture]|uniref:hypothetical protein n=1 Tax=Streptomyces sp. enrichment culture TaxID=1795815 RepID=UPI003F579B06
MTESGQGSGQQGAPQAGAQWNPDPAYPDRPAAPPGHPQPYPAAPAAEAYPQDPAAGFPPAPDQGLQGFPGQNLQDQGSQGQGAQGQGSQGQAFPGQGLPDQGFPGPADQGRAVQGPGFPAQGMQDRAHPQQGSQGQGFPGAEAGSQGQGFPGVEAAPAGHVLGPGYEGPGQPHGYGYPPLPEAVTQYIPPVPADPGSVPPAGPAAHDEAATQYIPPVPADPGSVPPTGPAAHDEAATQYIPPVPAGPGAGPDEAATQYIPPVTGDFDALFRQDGADDGHTRQMPPIQEPVLRRPPPRGQRPVPQPHPQQQYARQPRPQPGFAAPPPPPPEPARRVQPAVIAAVVIGLAVVGLGVGAMLSDPKAQNNDPAAAAAAPSPTGSAAAAAEAPVDPARSQAVQLDKVLADSADSRDSVIKAVDDIKGCRNLGTAADDLRSAARQREELVTRLQELRLDKLPNHQRLSASLTKAWKASADADNSYAAWAEDVADDKKKGCKDGHARNTDDAADGNKSSGEATRAKESAAALWNPIATKYNLPKRDKSQL